MSTKKLVPNSIAHKMTRLGILFIAVTIVAALVTMPTFADHAGTALEFDGQSEYVALGDTGDLFGGDGWATEKTISLWLKPGAGSTPTNHPSAAEMIVETDFPHLFGISRAVYNGQDRLWIWNADSNGLDTLGIEYTPDEWMHLALVHTGGVIYAYKDGLPVGSTNSGATYVPNNGAGDGRLFIAGSGRSDPGRYFGGQIDELRFWNLGLNAAEIAAWWDQEVTSEHPNWANLMAYYQMSDGAGVTLSDNSGNGRVGALSSGMGDGNWVVSEAFGSHDGTPTVVPTVTPTMPTATATNTLPPATETPTATELPPTDTPIPPATDTPPANTATPTETSHPPTDTPIPAATDTPPAATATPTETSPPPTDTPIPAATATDTPPSPTTTPASTQPTGPSYALEFDGQSEYVTLGDTGDLFGGGGWATEKTISLWLKPGAGSPPTNHPSSAEMIVETDFPHLFGISRAVYNGQDRLWIWNADSNGPDTLGIEYTPDEWMHLALVHTGGVIYAYKNGLPVGSTNSGATYVPNNGAGDGRLFIAGSGRSDPGRYFGGQIDELRFWNLGLDAAEIAAWWDQEVTSEHPNWANLMAYYQMSDGAGVTLSDNSGNDRAGALSSGMGDGNWISPGALDTSGPGPTATPTNTPPSATATPTLTALPPTETSPPPTATPGPTATNTPPAGTETPTPTAPPPTPTPEPTQPPTGSGFALQFDGNNDFVELHQTAFMFASGWESTKSVSMWVRPMGAGQPCPNQDVVACDSILGDRPRWWGITRGVRAGQDRIWIWNADFSQFSFIDYIGIEYTPDEWVHIALVHGNGLIRVYKNGLEVGQMFSGSTVQPNTGGLPVLHLGGVIMNSSVNATFEGQIDEVKLWNYARSESEIAQGMYEILTGSEPGLAAYYRMSSGAGVILLDDSVNSWNGLLLDGAQGVPPDGQYPLWITPGPF